MATGRQPQRGPFDTEPGPAGNAWDQPGANPGPSSYPASRSQDQRRSWSETDNNDQSQFFGPTTHFTRRDGTRYPYTPYVPAQPRPTPTQTLQTENAQLRRAIEAERQLWQEAEARLQQRTRAAPPPETRLEGLQQSRHAPVQAQARQYAPAEEQPQDDTQPTTFHENLLQELVRHNMQFSTRVTNTTEEILRRTNLNNGGTLKDTDVGLFEPKQMPDSAAAMNFIDGFYDAAIHYGEARTLAVLRKCCKNDIARSWVAGLSNTDRTAIR
jgi:hypothetical protein